MSSNDHQPAAGPDTWAGLIATTAPVYENGLAMFDDLPRELASSAPHYAGRLFAGVDNTVAALAVLRGSASVASLNAKIAPELPGVIRELRAPIDDDRLTPVLHTLSYLNVARCCGVSLPGDVEDAEQDWIGGLAEQANALTEPQRHTMALAACALARPSLVPGFADLPALPEPFTPHETFAFNVPGFAGYLAAAVDRGGTYADVEPAWLDFVHHFPIKLDTRTLKWPALLWAARAVYGLLAGIPDGEIADEVHKLVAGA